MPTPFLKESALKHSILVPLFVLVAGINSAMAQTVNGGGGKVLPEPAAPTNEQVLVLPPLVAPTPKHLLVVDAAAPVATQASGGSPPPSATADLSATPPTLFDARSNPERVWIGSEYLMWWTQGSHLPPLVTTGPAGAAPMAALGRPGTSVLFGGNVDGEERSGGRFWGGLWLNSEQTVGVEAGYLFLGQRSFGFAGASNGGHVLAIPYRDAATGGSNSVLFAGSQTTVTPQALTLTGLVPGNGAATTTTSLTARGNVAAAFANRLQGAEANLLWDLTSPGGSRGFQFLVLGGFRYLDLHEQLDLAGSAAQTGTALTLSQIGPEHTVSPTIAGNFVSTMGVSDHFDTRSQFYGGQLGAQAKLALGRVFFDITGKVALGNSREEVTINGAHAVNFTGTTMLAVPGPNIPPSTIQFQQVLPGGVFAQPTNIGHYSQNMFAVVPEVNMSVGYQITTWLRASIGYNFLYWSNVTRVGSTIDRTINPAAVAGSGFPQLQGAGSSSATLSHPSFTFRDTDFWAQGLTFTLVFTY
jgi:hypothetical protein